MSCGVQFLKTAAMLRYKWRGLCVKERQMISVKRTRTIDELMQFIDGTLEDEDYISEVTRCLYDLSLKDFLQSREDDEAMGYLHKKAKEHIKDKGGISEMSFGELMLAADGDGAVKGDCLVTFYCLFKGIEKSFPKR